MVLYFGFGEWLLAGFVVTGGSCQDRVCDWLVSVQGHVQATFERLMDRVLQGLRWSRCLVHLDDIISFGSTFSEALDNLTLIFERLRSYGLQLKSTKCHLFQTYRRETWVGVRPGED